MPQNSMNTRMCRLAIPPGASTASKREICRPKPLTSTLNSSSSVNCADNGCCEQRSAAASKKFRSSKCNTEGRTGQEDKYFHPPTPFFSPLMRASMSKKSSSLFAASSSI
eukprot:1503151-Rhodomonas_salina.3